MAQLDKARRKELKTKAVPRPAPVMATYDRRPAYRIAHACFHCRRSFKILVNLAKPNDEDRPCPGCRAPLAFMGRSFTAPKKTDIDQWNKIEALWAAGFRFFSYRSYPDAEPLPSTFKDVGDFIERNPRHPFRIG